MIESVIYFDIFLTFNIKKILGNKCPAKMFVRLLVNCAQGLIDRGPVDRISFDQISRSKVFFSGDQKFLQLWSVDRKSSFSVDQKSLKGLITLNSFNQVTKVSMPMGNLQSSNQIVI